MSIFVSLCRISLAKMTKSNLCDKRGSFDGVQMISDSLLSNKEGKAKKSGRNCTRRHLADIQTECNNTANTSKRPQIPEDGFTKTNHLYCTLLTKGTILTLWGLHDLWTSKGCRPICLPWIAFHYPYLVGNPKRIPSASANSLGLIVGTSGFGGAPIFSSTSGGNVSATYRSSTSELARESRKANLRW